MKGIKISMIAVIALVMGIAGSAFTTQQPLQGKDHPATTAWFKFMGDPSDLSQLKNNVNYTFVDGQPCSGDDVICAVLYSGTASSGHHPDAFSISFQNRIQAVYNGGTDAAVSEENE